MNIISWKTSFDSYSARLRHSCYMYEVLEDVIVKGHHLCKWHTCLLNFIPVSSVF